MLREPIRLEGTFTIRRESVRPFANRRPVLNQESANPPQPVVLLGTNYGVGLPLNGSVSQKLTFKTDMILQDISVNLEIADALPPNLAIRLVAPNGASVLLHDRANISPITLSSVSFPSTRASLQSFTNLLTSSTPSKGDWSLSISGTGGTLKTWSLRLQGQPVFDLRGRVVDESGQGVPAQVFLDGMPISQIVSADDWTNGGFPLRRLPGIPVNFTAQLPGFEPSNPGVPGLSSLYTLPTFPTNGLSQTARERAARFRPLPVMPFPAFNTAGFGHYGESTNDPVVLTLRPRADLGTNVQLYAAPTVGSGPLAVQFSLAGLSNALPTGAVINWDFGDGSTASGADLFATNHDYTAVATNGYLASVQIVGGPTLTQRILVMPSPGNTLYAENFFQVFFTSGGTIPTNLVSQIPGPYPADGPPQLVPLLMIQHADCASFDIDRAPYTDASLDFFTDTFTTEGLIVAGTNSVPVLNVDRTNGFKEEDSNYFLDPSLPGWNPPPWECADAYRYTMDDHLYRPLPEAPANPQCASTRFRMLCNIGPQIVPPPNEEVYALPHTEPIVAPKPDPLLANGREGLAAARDLRLVVGPLAWSWNWNPVSE